MSGWDSAELAAIVEADDLHIAPFRADGVTVGTPTWIWCVAVDGELFVRAYTGVQSRWYTAAMAQGAGQITAAGITYDVAFEAAAGEIDARIDDAYRAKYPGNEYLEPMLVPAVQAATVRIRPGRV